VHAFAQDGFCRLAIAGALEFRSEIGLHALRGEPVGEPVQCSS
jgi:hypothetical protein